MSQTLPEHVANRSFIDRKFAGVRAQIACLRGLAPADGSQATADSYATAAVDQTLQAMSALLQSLNLELPDPLPASRVTLRNLRDKFQSVQAESAALQVFEQAQRPGAWLDRLEQQRLGASFAPLLRGRDGGLQILLDPLEPDTGVAAQAPADYLEQALQQAEDLAQRFAQELPEDVVRFRDAHRKQTRRLI
jgi:hypothetical protein